MGPPSSSEVPVEHSSHDQGSHGQWCDGQVGEWRRAELDLEGIHHARSIYHSQAQDVLARAEPLGQREGCLPARVRAVQVQIGASLRVGGEAR